MKLRTGLAIVLVLSLAGAGRANGAEVKAGRVSEPLRHNIKPAQVSCGSFAAGYRAYQAHQLPVAISQFSTAVRRCAALEDYALYYLGCAQRDSGNSEAAAASLERLANDYPRSIFAADAISGLAQLEYSMGRYKTAEKLARQAIAEFNGSPAESARFTLAQTLTATGDSHAAYAELQTLRENFPQGPFDARARAAAYALLKLHPELADTSSLEYRRQEAALLLREGQSAAARDQIEAALRLFTTSQDRAELTWLLARAERIDPDQERAALLQYLKLAPHGTWAAAALDRLGHLYWRINDTVGAREMFDRVASEFPQSQYAPEAMFAAGRSLEDDHKLDRARAEYRRLAAQYPETKAAGQARFRIPWTLYMTKRYAEAARWFALERPKGATASDRAKFLYWQARALEKSGKAAAARGIFRKLARSTATNYYPALASLRCGVRLTSLPATFVSVPSSKVAPEVAGEGANFHLSRVLALRKLQLHALESPELLALEKYIGENSDLRDFVLGEMIASGAYYDSIVAASRLEKHGRLNPLVAERVRYPLAFPRLIIPQAKSAGVPPYLVMALTRQESLFNPAATSVSDARGLMQLLPSTALRVADDPGVTPNLYNPELNVRLGVTLLKKLLVVFDGNRFKAVAAYNAGKSAVERWNAQFPGDDDAWVENIGYRETRNYVKQVIGNLREYELLYPAGSAAPGSAANVAAGKTTRGPGA